MRTSSTKAKATTGCTAVLETMPSPGPIGNAPTIFVQKAINALDPLNPTATELAQIAPGRPLPVGTAVVWTYKVFNLGDGPIQVNVLRDDAGTPSNPADDFSPTPVLQAGFNYNLGDLDRDSLLDTNEAWLFTSKGSGSGTSPNWGRVYQDIVNATDSSGAGLTPRVRQRSGGHAQFLRGRHLHWRRVERHKRHRSVAVEDAATAGQG